MPRYNKKDDPVGNDMSRYLQQAKECVLPQQGLEAEGMSETDLKTFFKEEFHKLSNDF